MLDKDKLENPKIKIVWEDVAESFTQERIARIKSYFAKKYKSKNVTVVTKVVVSKNETKLDSIDMADNILDTQYQKELVKDYIKTNEIKVDWDLLSKNITISDLINNSSYFVAGGLNPSNVAELIIQHKPYGIDVSSGLESSIGKKDHLLMKKFIENVRISEKENYEKN